MALQTQPDFIPQPFAANGDKNEISTTSTTNGLASWVEGFNTINSMPLAAGGVAPSRLDFNGMFNVLSQFAMYAQQGGVFTWDEGQDYGASAIVKASNGEFYKSLQASGPHNEGAQSPLTAPSYWQKLTPDATATVAGILKLATEALALAGVDDTTAMTPLKTKKLIDASPNANMESYRLSRIGVPTPVASTTLDDSFKIADGSLVLFADYPELEAKYEASGLMVLDADSTAAQQAAKPLYFVANSGGTGLYLPRLSGLFARAWTGEDDGTAGGYNEAGLPNITGSLGQQAGRPFINGTGAFSVGGGEGVNQINGTTINMDGSSFSFDASDSNDIYGNATTVMPSSYNQPYAIYLGQPTGD